MSKTIETTVLKPHLAPNGVIVQRGETITVDEKRYKQLVKKGYVPNPDSPDEEEVDEPEGEPGAITNKRFEKRRSKIVGKSIDE
ncbi:hypothetical protein ACK9YZ_01295 [Rhizobium sp. ZK1]|uniref:hypothetical protein n=1 Tax=Rhizobium sp. ZK1 TaxID=3389872 RepID=UPI0039F6DF47